MIPDSLNRYLHILKLIKAILALNHIFSEQKYFIKLLLKHINLKCFGIGMQ